MKLVSEDILYMDNKMFLFANNMNILYFIDCVTGEYEFIGKIPDESISAKRLIAGIFEWEKIIYLIPLMSNRMWMYSIAEKKWESIDIEPYENNWAGSYFRNVYKIEDTLLIYGGYYPAFALFNLKTSKLTYDCRPFESKKSIRTEDLYFRGEPVCRGTNLFFASAVDNSILKYSVIDGSYEWIAVGKASNRYSGIKWDGNSFWLAPRNSEMSIIKMTDGEIEEYSIPTDNNMKFSTYIGMSQYEDGFFIPTGTDGGSSLLVDKKGDVKIVLHSYSFFKMIDGKLFFQYKSGDLVCVDGNGRKTYSGEISKNIFQNVIELFAGDENIHIEGLVQENTALGLDDWIQWLSIV